MSEPVALGIPGLTPPLQLHLHGAFDRVISQTLRREGIWEPYETALLIASLEPGAVFLDVGANIGYYSVIAARVVGATGAVFAFEPEARNFGLLQANLELNGCQAIVHAHEAGLADRDSDARLYLSEDNAGDHQVFAVSDKRAHCPIRLLNGTDYLTARLERLDLIKVDVQGAEYAVMVGLLKLLRSLGSAPRIIIELTPLSLRQCGASGRALIELLAMFGLPMWVIDHINHRLLPSNAEALTLWCDDVDARPGDAGFMNILIGPRVPGH
ncbi:MAG: FkbM family methyltransferase [Pseudomonadota bacterium]